MLAALLKCAVVAPAAGGIPVAFGVREALNADQIFWAEKDDGRYYFRQYLDAQGLKCILVDDVVRSGKVITSMIGLIRDAGATVVAIGSLSYISRTRIWRLATYLTIRFSRLNHDSMNRNLARCAERASRSIRFGCSLTRDRRGQNDDKACQAGWY